MCVCVCVCVFVCFLVLPVLCLTWTVIRFLSRKKVNGETSPQHSQEGASFFFLFLLIFFFLKKNSVNSCFASSRSVPRSSKKYQWNMTGIANHEMILGFFW